MPTTLWSRYDGRLRTLGKIGFLIDAALFKVGSSSEMVGFFFFNPVKLSIMDHKISVIDHKSILVVNPAGELKKVAVPFGVYIRGSEKTKKIVYTVDEVLTTEKDEIVYVIDSRSYFHHHFCIDILF